MSDTIIKDISKFSKWLRNKLKFYIDNTLLSDINLFNKIVKGNILENK